MTINFKGWRIAPPRLAEGSLAVLAVVLTVAVAVAVVQAVSEHRAAGRLGQAYTQLTGVKPAATAATPRDAMVQRLATHRLIAIRQEYSLLGVLGDAAIFNGAMMLKVGQSAGDMKILTIGPNWVEVEKDGQREKLYVFADGGMSAPPMAMPPAPPGRRRGP
jgi:hypothetical protein